VIPDSSQWVGAVPPDELRILDEKAQPKKINDGHYEFV
jgi:hypothetical protein